MPKNWKERLAWITVAALASILSHWSRLSRPFGLDQEGVMGGRFQAAFSKTWDLGGFFALGGRPILTPIPTEIISGDLYANHPPLHHWISYAFYQIFGRDEFALRLYPALACALLAAVLVDWIRQRVGRWAALLGLVAFVSSPMVRVYGSMANYESPLILFAFLAYVLLPEGKLTTKRGLCVAGMMFLAVAHDWPALFFLPAIFMARVVERQSLIRPVFWLGLGAFLAIVSYLLLLISWKGGFEHSMAALKAAFISGRESRPFEFTELLRRQYLHFRLGYGFFVFLILGYGSYAAFSKRFDVDTRNARLGLVWLLSGLCYLVAFPSRSIDHEFCWFYPVPGIILLFAVFCQDSIQRFRTKSLRVTTFVLLTLLIAYCGENAFDARPKKEMPQYFLDTIDACNKLMGSDAMILTPRVYAAAWFYLDPWIVENVKSAEMVTTIMTYFEGGVLKVRRLVVEIMPPLAASLDPSFLLEHRGQELRYPGIRLWVFDR